MAGVEYRTNNRIKIMNFLMKNSCRTVSVGDIAEHLKNQSCSVNITTIYRYLDKLERDGTVIKYTGKTGEKACYQYVEKEHNCGEHLHLKCTGCGMIIHLDCHFMNEIADHVEQDHGFQIQCRNSVIYGMCRQCCGAEENTASAMRGQR